MFIVHRWPPGRRWNYFSQSASCRETNPDLSDPTTGIGAWTEADFLQTLRRGVNPPGQSLHPFMPWRQNGRMSDDDLRGIYAFPRTLPPIRQNVPRVPAK
jgi:hypothetical protein